MPDPKTLERLAKMAVAIESEPGSGEVLVGHDPIDLSTYSGDAPDLCPDCFRVKANDADRQVGVRPRGHENLCWRWVIPGPTAAAECSACLVRLEKHSGDALMGCVAAKWDENADAALDAGLLVVDDVTKLKRTALGNRVLAALRAKLGGLCNWELKVLAGKTDGWGAAVGAAIEALRGRGLMEGYSNNAVGDAVVALHDREQDQ